MSEDSAVSKTDDPPIHHRTITLVDGRYMVFYTFGDEDPAAAADGMDDQGDDV